MFIKSLYVFYVGNFLIIFLCDGPIKEAAKKKIELWGPLQLIDMN